MPRQTRHANISMGRLYSFCLCHELEKIRKWFISILVATPAAIRGQLGKEQNGVQLRHPPELSTNYTWQVVSPGLVRGHPEQAASAQGTIHLRQEQDGIFWQLVAVEGESAVLQDGALLSDFSKAEGLVLDASPLLHGFPWVVDDAIANKHVLKALKRQPFRRYRHDSAKGLHTLVTKLNSKQATSSWAQGVQAQSPKELWARRGILTDFQVWTAFRVALGQLNLFHSERVHGQHCRLSNSCSTMTETLGHLFWDCPRAQDVWILLVNHWTGFITPPDQLHKYQYFIASRNPPQVSEKLHESAKANYRKFTKHHKAAADLIWWAYCSIASAALWMQRNAVIFRHERIPAERSKQAIWKSVIRQLRASALRDFKRPETKTQGLYMRQMLDIFEYIEITDGVINLSPRHGRRKTQQLVVERLESFQGSINQIS